MRFSWNGRVSLGSHRALLDDGKLPVGAQRLSPKVSAEKGGGGPLAFSSPGTGEFGACTLGRVDLDHCTWERQASETGRRPWEGLIYGLEEFLQVLTMHSLLPGIPMLVVEA